MPKFGCGDELKSKIISLDSLTPSQQILLNQLLQKGQTTRFANPALDYEGQDLDLHRRLVTHPHATFSSRRPAMRWSAREFFHKICW
jgi:hypothetical protein